MAQTFGIADIILKGVGTVDVEKGAKIKLGGYKQNPVLVNGKVHYAREYEGSEITFTTVLKRGQKISDLFAPGERECQVNCDTGQSFIFHDAFVTNRPDMTAGEGGKIEVKLSASEPQELQNG